MSASRVGLAHDYLLVMRGAERTFAEIAACWPEAPIYTSLYSPEGTEGRFETREVVTTPLQRLGLDQRAFRRALPLYGPAFRTLGTADHELIVSSSSAFAHQIRKPPGAVHVCYCHSPFRYAWHERDRAATEVAAPLRPALRAWLARARRRDLEAIGRVDGLIANSELTRQRIGEIYGREAEIVHPPVAVDRFRPGPVGEHLLVVSELVAHKRVELAIAAAALSGERLVIAGDGPARAELEAGAPAGVEFRGRVGDEELAALYGSARAVIVTAVEEFGIVAVEAQAAGAPVIAPAAGGAAETVLEGETGFLLAEFTPGAIAAAISEVASIRDPGRSIDNARRFAPQRFRERLRAAVSRFEPGPG